MVYVERLKEMYVTRPRSLYRKFPSVLSVQPQPDAAYSGHLVVSDQESNAMDSSCFGICKNDRIKRLPFPQDRILLVVHSLLHDEASVTKVWFLPVLDQPLSSRRYYVIKAKGRRKGQAYTCSKEGEIGGMCCFNNLGVEPKTRPFDYRDRYQQFEIHPYHSGGFFAKSIEWDGYPPEFLRKGGWEVYISKSIKLRLQQAQGFHISTTANQLPELNHPLQSKRSTPIVIGKWYCPFVFVKEEQDDHLIRVDDQMRQCLLYEWSLKQWWEEIYSRENEGYNRENNIVIVDARVKRLVCSIRGMEANKDEGQDVDGIVWFRVNEGYRRRVNVGLSWAVFEKLRWVQERRGWFDGERDVRVNGRKEFENGNEWRKFGCYVLVESFVLRRMDGSLLINFNFRDPQRIECKWE